MRKSLYIFVLVATFFPVGIIFALNPAITLFPDTVIQGEPLKIVVNNVSGLASVKKISFDNKTVGVFLYQGKPTAVIGIDLKKKAGDYKVLVTLTDGSELEQTIFVGQREKVEAPLGIPEKLGGNTPTAAKVVVNTLAQENQAIYAVRTFPRTLWTEGFKFPISNPIVTDPYGYSRQTVGYSITHKGTDLRSAEGTTVTAMNRGIVRIARTYQVYGKTIIIDHGLGLHTIYMHLSKIKVNEGELVRQGQLVGLSGKTGYAESPHLHISMWVDKVSIDPMKFMALFSATN